MYHVQGKMVPMLVATLLGVGTVARDHYVVEGAAASSEAHAEAKASIAS